MLKRCITCNREIFGFGTGYKLYGNYWVCKNCANLVGVNNMFHAGIMTRERFLKKYVKIKPEKNDFLKQCIKEKKKQKEAAQLARREKIEKIKKEEREKSLIRQKRMGCKMKTQEKYQCTSCENIWYINDLDNVKNLYNITHFNCYTANNMKNVSQCPKCGSIASIHKTVKLWIDNKGNCVDVEE